MKEVSTNTTKIKDHKRLLWTVICQQIRQLEEMDKFLELWLENLKRPIIIRESESVIKNPKIKTPELSQTLVKQRRGNTSKLILAGQHYPDTKVR